MTEREESLRGEPAPDAGQQREPPPRTITYCIVPGELAEKLHEPLREHFADDPGVEVVVERRGADRRARDRRGPESDPPKGQRERREVLNLAGRRVGERRAPVRSVQAPTLPRRARRHAERLMFVERTEPRTERAEDADTARLVLRYQAGEDRDRAFSTLYARYYERVYSYLLVALANKHDAEDGAQEVFANALAALPKYERRTQPFRAWLFKIARNHAIDQLRRQGKLEPMDPEELDRRREDEDPAQEPDLPIVDWIADRDLGLFVERLPLPQRQALVLRYTADLSDKQIAAIMNRTPADVRMLLSRGLSFLRERLTAVGKGTESKTRAKSKARVREATVLRSRRWSLDP